jgi:hypothetical protein
MKRFQCLARNTCSAPIREILHASREFIAAIRGSIQHAGLTARLICAVAGSDRGTVARVPSAAARRHRLANGPEQAAPLSGALVSG